MAILETALAEVWDELPDLIGADWPAVEQRLLGLLRQLEAEGDASVAAGEIEALLAAYPEARDRVTAAKVAAEAEEAETMRGLESVAAVRKGRHVEVPVFYGTVREPTGSTKPSEFYGTERGALGLGRVTVSIPDDHRMGSSRGHASGDLSSERTPTNTSCCSR